MVAQLIVIGLMMMGLGISMAKHGESMGDHNCIIRLVAVVINILLLWWGGFFDVFF